MRMKSAQEAEGRESKKDGGGEREQSMIRLTETFELKKLLKF